MTYRELLRTLTSMAAHSPDHLDDYVAVIPADTITPLFITHTEYNDGSITDGVEPYQLLLMTV
jgi:hypothetical protein